MFPERGCRDPICCIFNQPSGATLNASQNMLFQCFTCKKEEKARKFKKKHGILSLHPNADRGVTLPGTFRS